MRLQVGGGEIDHRLWHMGCNVESGVKLTVQKFKEAPATSQVRKTPSWPRSWANFSPLYLYSHKNARANLYLLSQPNTFLAGGRRRPARAGGGDRFDQPGGRGPQVRKTPRWPGSWADPSLLFQCSHRNAWANLHFLGQPNTFLAAGWASRRSCTASATSTRTSPRRRCLFSTTFI